MPRSVNFFFVKEYTKHFLLARTAHGIHSPFIYKMVTKCLRNRAVFIQARFYSSAIPLKYNRIINRLISFYDFKKISTEINTRDFQLLITQNFDDKQTIIKQLKENQYWIVLNIRKNKETLCKWSQTQRSPEIDITVDLFQIGIVIKRKQQAKENFRLKPIF